ncbi:SET and MYND domain-containing protein 4 [Anopheles gambiae]|uniref:SET and MYND domain-containing protein 4 n=1 Tax=Anopheles gambiae TaxID=7165 RepID=UPI002AC8ACF1|nr:SET and MYND domain-containing protein 4 [Anopheles gambiae]
MYGPLSDKNYDVTKLFGQLWEETLQQRIIESTQNQPDDDRVAAIIKCKIDDFLCRFPFHERLQLQPDAKDNAKALAARVLGNELFALPMEEKYLQALRYYNESISYSAQGSETRALAYGNRSVVCLKFGLSQECLENIRLARASNYPARLADKLNKREQHVKRCIQHDPPVFPDRVKHTPGKYRPRSSGHPAPKLSYEAHANVPQLVKCVELRQDSEFGRHLVTTQHLKAGDVLLIEKPYANLLIDVERHVRCAFCQNEDRFTLIPCEGCTVTMYCSEECRDKAHKQYHRYECGVLRDCWRIVGHLFGGMVGLRTVATAIASFDQDLGGWNDHLNTLDETNVNAFTMDWNNATVSDIYDTVQVLATNQKRRCRKDLAELIFFASIVHRLLLERTDFGPLCESNPIRSKLLFDLLLRHVQTSLINKKRVHHMEAVEVKDEEDEDTNEKVKDELNDYFDYDNEEGKPTHFEERPHAMAVYPLSSMLNHSCVPNVVPINLLDGRCAIVAIRPIAAVEQLFDNLGTCTIRHGRSIRGIYLQDCYLFQCSCGACQSHVECAYTDPEEATLLRNLELLPKVETKLLMLLWHMNQDERYYTKHQLTAMQHKLVHTLRMMHSFSPDDELYLVVRQETLLF